MGELGEKMHITYTHSMFKSSYNPVEKTTQFCSKVPLLCVLFHTQINSLDVLSVEQRCYQNKYPCLAVIYIQPNKSPSLGGLLLKCNHV